MIYICTTFFPLLVKSMAFIQSFHLSLADEGRISLLDILDCFCLNDFTVVCTGLDEVAIEY